MRVKVSLVIILAISMNGMAQKTEDIIVERNHNGIISSVKYPREDKNVAVPENSAMFFANVLKVRNDDSFKLQQSSNAKYGMSFERYTQFYQGIEVDGGFYSFRYKTEGCWLPVGTMYQQRISTQLLPSQKRTQKVFLPST